MLKDERLRESELTLKRHVTLTAATAYTMSPKNEIVEVALPVGSTSFDITLPNASEASRDTDYMVRILSQGGTGVATVKSGAESWNAVSIALNAANEYAVCRTNGIAWYTVDSKT